MLIAGLSLDVDLQQNRWPEEIITTQSQRTTAEDTSRK